MTYIWTFFRFQSQQKCPIGVIFFWSMLSVYFNFCLLSLQDKEGVLIILITLAWPPKNGVCWYCPSPSRKAAGSSSPTKHVIAGQESTSILLYDCWLWQNGCWGPSPKGQRGFWLNISTLLREYSQPPGRYTIVLERHILPGLKVSSLTACCRLYFGFTLVWLELSGHEYYLGHILALVILFQRPTASHSLVKAFVQSPTELFSVWSSYPHGILIGCIFFYSMMSLNSFEMFLLALLAHKEVYLWPFLQLIESENWMNFPVNNIFRSFYWDKVVLQPLFFAYGGLFFLPAPLH